MSSKLAFSPPEVFDPDKVTVESWVRKMKNYLASVGENDGTLITEFAFDRLSPQVQYWYDKVHLESKKRTRAQLSVEGLYAALAEKYGKRDLFASRDVFWKLPNGDLSAFLSSFTENARSSVLPQDELVYILANRLPHRYALELRKSPPDDLYSAIDSTRRLLEAGSDSGYRPFNKPFDPRGKEGAKDGYPGKERGGERTQSLNTMTVMSGFPPVSGAIIAALDGENTRTTLNFGVEENLIPWRYVRENRISYSLGRPTEVTLPDGHRKESKATCEMEVSHRGSSAKMAFYIVDGIQLPVLGRPWEVATAVVIEDD